MNITVDFVMAIAILATLKNSYWLIAPQCDFYYVKDHRFPPNAFAPGSNWGTGPPDLPCVEYIKILK